MLQYMVFIGAALQLIGALSYVKKTLSGHAKPNRMTWLMWTIAPLIGTAAAIASGVRWAVLPVFMAGFGPLLVFLSSFVNPKSYWQLGSFDYICGLFSLLALILWGITKQPIIAIIFSIASDGFAAVPTLVKAWRYPETETVAAYVATLFSVFTGFLAVKNWNVSSLAFLVYLMIIDVSLVGAILRGTIRQRFKIFLRRLSSVVMKT